MARKSKTPGFPTRTELIEATFSAIRDCSGSATIEEINSKVISILELPDEVVNVLKNDHETKLEYELRWARTYLKKAGVLQNSQRGVWVITPKAMNITSIDGKEIAAQVRAMPGNKEHDSENNDGQNGPSSIDFPEDGEEEPWREELGQILRTMNPFAFERLSMYLLRECGLSNAEVTKKTGDGGIDGFGSLKLNGLITLSVAFQCKRQASQVSSTQIREFRGSINAFHEKGIFITTGTFSREAVKEANDSGKGPVIDLIDGEEFISLLLEHSIGVRQITAYEIDYSYFEGV